MSTQGPVCHIPPKTVAETHDPVALPSIPPAQPNLQSLTAAVNVMRQVVQIIAGQIVRGPQGIPGRPGQNGQSARSGSWVQKDIQTERVKIYQNNDPSTGNYVEVERVNKLVMQNPQTQQTWTYNRPQDGS